MDENSWKNEKGKEIKKEEEEGREGEINQRGKMIGETDKVTEGERKKGRDWRWLGRKERRGNRRGEE